MLNSGRKAWQSFDLSFAWKYTYLSTNGKLKHNLFTMNKLRNVLEILSNICYANVYDIFIDMGVTDIDA